MLKELFMDLKINKSFYSSARNGDQFEQKFKNKLKAYGFSEIVQRPKTKSAINEIANNEELTKQKSNQTFSDIKKKILLKNSIQVVDNPFKKIKNAFIFQPYGSRQFPDFLLILQNKIIPIEIKYSKNENGGTNIHTARPMWNANIPKPNAIYIYGVANKITTFFLGSDILDFDTREHLVNFFKELNKGEVDLNRRLLGLKNDFGIYPYIRKVYEHKKDRSTYVDIEGKQIIESYFSENANAREENVINFIRELENEAKQQTQK